MVDRHKIGVQLELEEGLRLELYDDETGKTIASVTDAKGNASILIGYNVTARGWDQVEEVTGRKFGENLFPLTEQDARAVLEADVDRIEPIVKLHLTNYDELSEVRQRVCVDMAFNMGFHALDFKKGRAALQAGDWSGTAREMVKSDWYEKQPRARTDRLVNMMLTNNDYRSW